MSGGSVDGSGLIQVREECRLQPVSLVLADIDHGSIINVNNFEIADGVFISTEIAGLLPPSVPGGWSSTTSGGATIFKISSKREFDITISSLGNAANEPVDILTPGFTFNLGASGVQVTATRFHNNNDFSNPFSFTWTGVTEVRYRVVSAGGFNSVSAIAAFETVRPKTVRYYADAEEPNEIGLVLVGEKGSFEEFDEATVQGWDLCEQKEPTCFFPNGDPEPVVDGGGTLLDGETSYTINNISNGTIIYSSTTPGDVRTETGDVIEITATCPVNVFLRPTVNAAPILNPLVWSRGVTALPNYVFSGPFSFASTDGEPIEYSPGAFDAQLSLVEDATQPQGGQNFNLGLGHSAFATLLNANAPRASQDWGVVTMKAGQTFRIGGRDADAYNITIQPLIEREICEVVKENIDRIEELENPSSLGTVKGSDIDTVTTNGVKVSQGDLIQENADGTTYGTPSVAEYNEFINNFGPQYLALSYEAAGGASVIINVNGVDATYTDTSLATPVGNGQMNFSGGTNGNFNRRARVDAEVLKNVGDYVEIRLVNVAPFSQLIIALTQDTADLAHTTSGVYNFRATAGSNGNVESYNFRDRANTVVASGSETNAVYRITKTLAGVSFRRDGVELYCTVIDQFIDYRNQPRDEINLISPDGTVWAVSVDNSGGIVTTEVI